MITIDELKVQLADYGKAVKDLEEALAIDASRKRVQELEHTMSRPGFYDDADLSKKVFDEVGDLKGKLSRFEKLQGLYDDAETMLEMLDEEYDPAMIPEAEESVNAVGKAVDELQLMTMLNGEYDHSNAILTFHAGTGGTEAQDWAEMLYRMYNKWAQAHGMTVEVLDYQDGDEAGMKSASMMVKGANAYGLLKSENGVHRLVRVSPFDANARRQTSFASLEVMPELDNTIQVDIRPEDIEMQVYRSSGAGGQQDFVMGAYLSKGGKSFICLSSTFMNKKTGKLESRIRPTLENGSIVTDTRANVHYLCTEYGCVNLKGLTTWEKAEALISVAHPDFREDLLKEAEKMHIWRRSNKI